MKFTFMQPYLVDLSRGGMKYGPVPEQRLHLEFRDGRIAGLVNEELIAEVFGMTRLRSKNAPYDLLHQEPGEVDPLKLDAKGLTDKVSFLPSNQVGQGRTKDLPAYHERRAFLDGYVVVDLRASPRFTILGIEAYKAPDKGHWTARQWDAQVADWRILGMPQAIPVPRSW